MAFTKDLITVAHLADILHDYNNREDIKTFIDNTKDKYIITKK